MCRCVTVIWLNGLIVNVHSIYGISSQVSLAKEIMISRKGPRCSQFINKLCLSHHRLNDAIHQSVDTPAVY